MDLITLIALITGISGFIGSMVSLLVGVNKQKNENKKLETDIIVDTATVANTIISSAGTLTEIQEKIYEKSLKEWREQVFQLQSQINLLQNASRKTADSLLIHEKTIEYLSDKDRNNSSLISRLIKGIDVLIKQLRELSIEPAWIPSAIDLQLAEEVHGRRE